MPKLTPEEISQGFAKLPLRYVFPEDSKVLFSHVATIHSQPDSDVVILSFFHVEEPVLTGSEEQERIEELEKVEYVTAKCTCRIALTTEQSVKVAQLIINHLKTREKRKEEGKDNEGTRSNA